MRLSSIFLKLMIIVSKSSAYILIQKKRFFRPYTLKFDHLFAFIFADILIYLNKLNHFTLIV